MQFIIEYFEFAELVQMPSRIVFTTAKYPSSMLDAVHGFQFINGGDQGMNPEVPGGATSSSALGCRRSSSNVSGPDASVFS